ncbi:MAG TPA: hypothetical protein VFN10_19365 [Thermoanaerobaculia bacterium]|nr:hypothetical protein [Thermoanaerobaculia bacterium]
MRSTAVPNSKAPTGVTDRTLIRELFIERMPFYSFDDTRRLTRSTPAAIDAAIATGEIAPETYRQHVVLPWDDVARLALDRWTPRMIDGALGSTDRLAAIPLLNRVQQLAVFLPVYQVRLLHYLAETNRGQFRARLNASDVLEQHLLDLASAVDADELELAIPGFQAACHYPTFVPRADDWGTAFCWYCGRVSDVPGQQICTDCHARHEPRPHLGEDGIPELDEEE